MKLAFSGLGRYTDYSKGYEVYVNRSRTGNCVDEKTYKRIIRKYCKLLSEQLESDGMVDLPNGLGSIAAVEITRKPQYRGKQFVGYGKMDWRKGHYDGTFKAFGLVFLPRRDRTGNLRCFGFVANRKLFKRVRATAEREDCPWRLLEFNDDMI